VLCNTIKMASLDDIINITEQLPKILIETDNSAKDNNILFTFNEI